MKIFYYLLYLIIILTFYVNFNLCTYNEYIKQNYYMVNASENYNYIFPKPKSSYFVGTNGTYQNIMGSPVKVSVTIDINTPFNFKDREWNKNDRDQAISFYKKLFSIYPMTYRRSEVSLEFHNTIKRKFISVYKTPTLSKEEYEATYNNTIPYGYNENYEIYSSYEDLKIFCSSVFGLQHALKSLFQSGYMVIYYDNNGGGKAGEFKKLHLKNLPFSINDRPRLNYRGLLIDSGRFYLEPSFIKSIIETMSLLKLNALHWHITDDQSFPIEIPEYPKLHSKGSNHLGYIHNNIKYKKNKNNYYKESDIKEIVDYAKLFGIRVIPEIDMPAHTLSWSKGYENLTSHCPKFLETKYNEINGKYTYSLPLDISNEFTFKVIESILNRLKHLFPDPYLHIGGDEVQKQCWEEDIKQRERMVQQYNILDTSQYMLYFYNRLKPIIEKVIPDKKIIYWEDVMDMLNDKDINLLKLVNNNTATSGNDNNNNNNNRSKKNYIDQKILNNYNIFQIWRGPDQFNKLQKLKIPFIYSFGNYLDPSYQSCNKFENCLFDQENELNKYQDTNLLIGIEACAWEMVPRSDVYSIEKDGSKQERSFNQRFWPRLLGISEKMWSESKPYFNLLNDDEKSQIKTNTIKRAKKMLKLLDKIIKDQNIIDSDKIHDNLY